MTIDQDAIKISEYAVAKLEIHDGEVLLVKPSEFWTPEQRSYLALMMEEWGMSRGLSFNVLIPPSDCEISVAKAPKNHA